MKLEGLHLAETKQLNCNLISVEVELLPDSIQACYEWCEVV